MEGLPDSAELALLCDTQRHIKNAKHFRKTIESKSVLQSKQQQTWNHIVLLKLLLLLL